MFNYDTRVNPEVDETVLNDFQTTLRLQQNGKLKGRTGPALSDAAVIYTALTFLRDPSSLEERSIEQLEDPEYEGNVEDFQERVLGYAKAIEPYLDQAQMQLGEEFPLQNYVNVGVEDELEPDDDFKEMREDIFNFPYD